MNATSTHDTKRSEDVRARLNVLSELAPEWERALFRWKKWNDRHKEQVNGLCVPAAADEAMLYQTLLGVWPFDQAEEEIFHARVQEFLRKAVREAKVHSEWIRPNEAYEEALFRFAGNMFSAEPSAFKQDFLRLQRKIAWYGMLNALSQVLIKITAPGVPDFYQGCEMWDFSLVDPDNRRPVDFRRNITILEELRRAHSETPRLLLRDIMSNWQDGRIKLYLTDRALDLRIANDKVYLDGEYLPLEVTGDLSANVLAFARRKDGHWCITVVPRLYTQIAKMGRMPIGKTIWRDTQVLLPNAAPESLQSALTGERIKARSAPEGRSALAVADVLNRFPVALLRGTGRD